MAGPVDAREVLGRIAKEWGMDPPIRAEVEEARAGVDDVIDEGQKIETSIHALGLSCTRFSAALDRVTGGNR